MKIGKTRAHDCSHSKVRDDVSKRRLFDRIECQNCIYCWNQCPYNIWKKEPF